MLGDLNAGFEASCMALQSVEVSMITLNLESRNEKGEADGGTIRVFLGTHGVALIFIDAEGRTQTRAHLFEADCRVLANFFEICGDELERVVNTAHNEAQSANMVDVFLKGVRREIEAIEQAKTLRRGRLDGTA
jgi:hypothetical protein